MCWHFSQSQASNRNRSGHSPVPGVVVDGWMRATAVATSSLGCTLAPGRVHDDKESHASASDKQIQIWRLWSVCRNGERENTLIYWSEFRFIAKYATCVCVGTRSSLSPQQRAICVEECSTLNHILLCIRRMRAKRQNQKTTGSHSTTHFVDALQ